MHAAAAYDRTALLERIPLFSSFGRAELDELVSLFVEVSYRRGDVVCREGEPGETFFVCVSGELDVVVGTPPRVVNRLGPGSSFGEISLLLAGTRAATVVAARNTRLLALNKPAFERHFLHNAKVLETLSRELARQLAAASSGREAPRATTVVAVTAAPGLRGRTLVANGLTALLSEVSGRPAVLVRCSTRKPDTQRLATMTGPPAGDLEARMDRTSLRGVGVLTLSADEHAPGTLSRLVERLREHAAFVVIDTDSPLEEAATESAHVLVRLVDTLEVVRPAGPRTFDVLNLFNPGTAPIPVSHCEPFVMRVDPALRDLDAAAQLDRLRRTPRGPAATALHRLARKIAGNAVGLVLGGGAAFGLVHIGVLEVLEAEGIPVDLVVGCSMGSLVAMGWAAGMTANDLLQSALRLGTRWNIFRAITELSFTKPGLIVGNRVVQMLLPLIEPVRDFDELRVPCRVVATDIHTGERIALGSGRLADAGRASCAIPMLLCPVEHEGRVLVDGGVVDPVPAEVVRDMGADVCIAVNAVPPLRKGVETGLSRWYRRAKQLDPLAWLGGSAGLPTTLDVVMNSMQSLQHELGNFKAISADVRICPDLAGFTWIEFYRPQEIVDRGIEAAQRALPDIRRLLRRTTCERFSD